MTDKWLFKSETYDNCNCATAATRLLNAGLSLSEIANHMGWSIRHAANVIEHYARVSPGETDAVLVKLAHAKGGGQ